MGRFIHPLAIACHLALLGLLFVWLVWFLEPPHWPRPLLILLVVLPLAFPVRGLLDQRPSSYLWSLALALVYAMHGATELWLGTEQPWLSTLEMLFALATFVSASLALRLARIEEAASNQSPRQQP